MLSIMKASKQFPVSVSLCFCTPADGGVLPQRAQILGRVLIGAVACFLSGSVALHAQSLGVRHRIDATVAASPDSPLLESNRGGKGTLSFTMRLSANSLESRFFGMISPAFSDIVIREKGEDLVAQTKVWEEDKCHQRRGLPKVTVTSLQASFGDGKNRTEVESHERHIGLRVPPDELTPGIKLPAGTDKIGAFYAWRAQSRDTRLNVDLKIYSFDCFLNAS